MGMKHRPSRATIVRNVELTAEHAEFLNRKKAAAEGKVYVPQDETGDEVRASRVETVDYCSATGWLPDSRTCGQRRRAMGIQGVGICRERCAAWLMRT